jgi:hypothetical protein
MASGVAVAAEIRLDLGLARNGENLRRWYGQLPINQPHTNFGSKSPWPSGHHLIRFTNKDMLIIALPNMSSARSRGPAKVPSNCPRYIYVRLKAEVCDHLTCMVFE